ncbi:MAG: T9SS type A sorting domain-containing protein [Bacteroidia bacterium]|nr:T9SS type A sorting domain-containing protein [Bacteroidia bacterium]MCZ2248475.1 T9SS type A sorting domain-containing protein [Bacteroidia bacterium]
MNTKSHGLLSKHEYQIKKEKNEYYNLKNKRYLSKKYLLLIALMFSTLAIKAQWNNSGPEGRLGYISKIQQNGNRLYILGSRLFHSDDNGDTWQVENFPSVTINDLYFLPTKILAATSKGIFVSTNNGLSWQSQNTGIVSADSTSSIVDIDKIGNRLLAVGLAHVYYSDNDGLSWSYGNNLGNGRRIAVLNSTVLVSINGGIYRSTDNGQTFNLSNAGISGAIPNMQGLLNFNGNIYCHKFNSIEIYTTADEGISWSLINNGITGAAASEPRIVNNTLFARTANQLFQLNGNSWSPSTLDNGSNPTLLNYSNGIYLGFVNSINSSDKLVKSNNNGSTWSETLETPYMYDINKLITANGILFAINNTGSFFKFNPTNLTWSRFVVAGYDFGGTLLSSLSTQVFCVSFGAGNKYYVGTDGGVWSSNDNGVTWVQSHVGLPITNTPAGYKTVKDLYINGNAIIAATTGGIYRSTDQANTWTQVSTLACNDLQKYGSYLYATGNGVFRSNDNGLTWTAFAGATSGGPFLYITGAGGKIFTSPQAIGPTSLTNYADTSATSFTVMASNIGDAYGYGDYLFTGSKYINTAISLSSFSDMSDNLPCYYGSVALGCYEPYANTNTVFGDNLWLGTTGFSTWYRSLVDFGFPVTTVNVVNENKEIKVYPNPTTNSFTIQNASSSSLVNIFNMQGAQVLNKKLTENIEFISIEELLTGIYFYQITDNEGSILGQGKVIKN